MKKYIIYVLLIIFVVTGIFGCAAPPTLTITKVPANIVWPEPPDVPRVKLIAGYRSSFDVEGPSLQLLRVIGEEREIYLSRPHGIAADREGNIYVSDIGHRVLKVYKFDFEKNKFRIIGATGAQKLKIPLGLAIDDERGLLFVADSGSKNVVAFDKDSGKIKFIIGQEPGTFQRPVAVVADTERQRIYVADTKLHMIKAFDYKSRLLFSIGKGERSADDDGFNVPSQIALDRQGSLYVADTFNRYIKVFDPEGRFIKKIGYGVGMGFGNFSKLTGVAVNSEGHIYGLDTDFGNFQIFDQENNLLLAVGESGGAFGRFLTPSNIFIDENDRIYVTDTFNRRIQVFQYLGKK